MYFRSRADILKSKKKALEEHEVFLQALDRFMKVGLPCHP